MARLTDRRHHLTPRHEHLPTAGRPDTMLPDPPDVCHPAHGHHHLQGQSPEAAAPAWHLADPPAGWPQQRPETATSPTPTRFPMLPPGLQAVSKLLVKKSQ